MNNWLIPLPFHTVFLHFLKTAHACYKLNLRHFEALVADVPMTSELFTPFWSNKRSILKYLKTFLCFWSFN